MFLEPTSSICIFFQDPLPSLGKYCCCCLVTKPYPTLLQPQRLLPTRFLCLQDLGLSRYGFPGGSDGKEFPGGSDGKESALNAGDLGSIPGWRRSSGEGNGYPLQYSCLENSMDRGAWWVAVHGVAKRRI